MIDTRKMITTMMTMMTRNTNVVNGREEDANVKRKKRKTRPMDKIMYLIELLDDECNFYTCQAVVVRLRDMVCEWVS